jgi:hypothetical protein
MNIIKQETLGDKTKILFSVSVSFGTMYIIGTVYESLPEDVKYNNIVGQISYKELDKAEKAFDLYVVS